VRKLVGTIFKQCSGERPLCSLLRLEGGPSWHGAAAPALRNARDVWLRHASATPRPCFCLGFLDGLLDLSLQWALPEFEGCDGLLRGHANEASPWLVWLLKREVVDKYASGSRLYFRIVLEGLAAKKYFPSKRAALGPLPFEGCGTFLVLWRLTTKSRFAPSAVSLEMPFITGLYAHAEMGWELLADVFLDGRPSQLPAPRFASAMSPWGRYASEWDTLRNVQMVRHFVGPSFHIYLLPEILAALTALEMGALCAEKDGRGEAVKELVPVECSCPFPWVWFVLGLSIVGAAGFAAGRRCDQKACTDDTPKIDISLSIEDIAREQRLEERLRQAVEQGISDVRVQPVSLDAQGNRHRSFRDAILMMREDAWPDWPIRVRYRVEGAEKARLNALRESRDFEDSRDVVYAEAAARPPDYMPLGFMDVDPLLFEEIPADLMRPQDWKDVLAVRVGYDADIMQLEDEALALACKHILRAGAAAGAQRETRVATAQRLTAQRGPLGSLTGLEQIAIRLVTEALYKKNATAFLDLCAKLGLDWHDVVELDAVLAQHVGDCSHHNVSSDHGTQRLGGLAHLYPSLQVQWELQWPRAARASIPWKRRVPVGAQLPLPKAVAMAMCLLLVEAGAPWMAVWVALSFVAYLRPSETFKCLWSFAVEALRPKYSRCLSLLCFPQVSGHLRGLRHGGALDGSVSRRRSAFQGGLQSRLASVKSLERYGKETKLLPEIRSAHGGVFRLGHLKLEHFWAVVMADGTLEASIGHLIPATLVLAVRAARRITLRVMVILGHAAVAGAAATEALAERVRLLEGEVTRRREVLAENENLRRRLGAGEQRLAMGEQRAVERDGGAAAAAAPGPSSGQVVDTRLLNKPRTFTGLHSEWKIWSFDFEAYVFAVHPRLGDLPNQVEVRKAPRGNGLAAWWHLFREFAPKEANRFAAMLGRIIRCEFADPAMASSAEFEQLVRECADTSGEVNSDNMKRGVIVSGINEKLADHLSLNASRLVTYDDLKRELKTICSSQRRWAAADSGGDGAVPMQVDAIGKGNGKDGKGK
ncbi:unnamed protein product, partial [Prorocentrum cordatum]